MSARKDLANKKFNRLTVIKYSHSDERGEAHWVCKCDCGNMRTVRGSCLRMGRSQSCGCYRKENNSKRMLGTKICVTHGMSKTRFHEIWCGMIDRCNNKNNQAYHNYGGRGIKVCKKWLVFDNFKNDMLSTYKKGLTLDRINNNKGYGSSNCRWATQKQQLRNTRRNRTYRGKCMTEWAELVGIGPKTLHKRLVLGWPWEKALSTPIDLRFSN